jgi:hypothetical protein
MNFANAIFALELLELFYHYEGFLCHPVDQIWDTTPSTWRRVPWHSGELLGHRDIKHFLMGNYRRIEVICEQDLCIWTTLVLKGLFRNYSKSTCMLPKENNNEGNSNFLLNIGWFEFPHVLCVFYLHLHVYLKAHLCYGIPKWFRWLQKTYLMV